MVGKVLSDELSCMQSGLVSKGLRFEEVDKSQNFHIDSWNYVKFHNNRNDHTVLLYSVKINYWIGAV